MIGQCIWASKIFKIQDLLCTIHKDFWQFSLKEMVISLEKFYKLYLCTLINNSYWSLYFYSVSEDSSWMVCTDLVKCEVCKKRKFFLLAPPLQFGNHEFLIMLRLCVGLTPHPRQGQCHEIIVIKNNYVIF